MSGCARRVGEERVRTERQWGRFWHGDRLILVQQRCPFILTRPCGASRPCSPRPTRHEAAGVGDVGQLVGFRARLLQFRKVSRRSA